MKYTRSIFKTIILPVQHLLTRPFFGFLLVFLGISAFSCTSSTHEVRPNIILINIDDMGWLDLGFMGSQYYHTPNIDRLASRSLVFTNAYASASNCAPSRACLMTGRWSPRHGIYTVASSERGESRDRKIIPTANTITLDPELDVFPEILQQHGYATCAAGKWHLSDDPTEYGFDVNIGGNHKGNPGSYYPPYKNVDLESETDQYLTDLIMDRSIQFVQSAEQPFFLYYSPYAVHTPLNAIDSLLPRYKDKPPWNGQQNIRYATMVENLDRNIGRLIRVLEDKTQWENTLIVFTTDNGGVYGITNQSPLRDGKGSYYEGGIRVPFFVFWNNVVEAGENVFPVSNLDVFPTLIDLLELDYPLDLLDGMSLTSILLNPGQEILEAGSRSIYWHFPIYLEAYNRQYNQSRDSLFRTRLDRPSG